jgi:ribosome biogenesis GTPase
MPFPVFSLHQLGWRPRLARGLTLAEFESGFPARVMSMRHDALVVLSSRGELRVAGPPMPDAGPVAVGDWLMLDRRGDRAMRLLDRHSVIARAPFDPYDADASPGPMMANVDVLFVVLAAHERFNIARLSHCLAHADAAGIEPVVLVQVGCGSDSPAGEAALQRRLPSAAVRAIGMGDDDVARLLPWLAPGQTIAVAGSPGADTAGLVRSLAGEVPEAADWSLRPALAGAWVIDTPRLCGLQPDIDELALSTGHVAAGRSGVAARARAAIPHDGAGGAVMARPSAGYGRTGRLPASRRARPLRSGRAVVRGRRDGRP